jgi:hypothetical protein
MAKIPPKQEEKEKFDDALRTLLNTPPQPKDKKKQKGPSKDPRRKSTTD